MDIFEAAKKLQIITVGSEKLIGVLEGKTILHALVDFENFRIRHWIESFNVGELTTVVLSDNQGSTCKSLSKEQSVELDICLALIRNVKEHALHYYENDLFDRFYKKR